MFREHLLVQMQHEAEDTADRDRLIQDAEDAHVRKREVRRARDTHREAVVGGGAGGG